MSAAADIGRIPMLLDKSEAIVAHCLTCRHRLTDQRATERKVPGLGSFGSAYGASISSSRLCALHDQWVSPEDSCRFFSGVG
jgi:hypothetical protein